MPPVYYFVNYQLLSNSASGQQSRLKIPVYNDIGLLVLDKQRLSIKYVRFIGGGQPISRQRSYDVNLKAEIKKTFMHLSLRSVVPARHRLPEADSGEAGGSVVSLFLT